MPISKIKSSAIDANAITGAGIADGSVTSADLDTNIAITGDLTVDTNTLYVDSTNNRVGVNTSSPRFPFQVEVSRTSSTNAVALNLSDGVTGIQTDGVYKAIRSQSNGTASESEIRFVETDGTNNNTAIAFATAQSAGALSEKMRILPSGGITFNGDTAAANALDDYEEGTWTPEVLNGWGILSPTYSTNTGYYTKIGNLVYILFKVVLSGGSTNGNPLVITGLPFNSNATTGGSGIYDTLHGAFTVSSTNGTSVFMQLGTNNINNVQGKYRVGNGTNNFTGTDAGGSFNCTFSGVYRTDA